MKNVVSVHKVFLNFHFTKFSKKKAVDDLEVSEGQILIFNTFAK
jgi:hypothetical protein